jgi:uncharacterized integral membrane protein (TIGR00697 family)
MQPLKHYDTITVAFVTVLLASNVASSAKIVDWGVSILGLPLAFDAGTVLFPVSYVFGDILTEVYGYRRTRRVIWSGFGAAAALSALLWAVGVLPGEATWQANAGDAAYQAILGAVSSGGIVLASLVAYLGGEFSNSYVLAKLKVRMQGRQLWMRTIGSTLVGQTVDTGVFVLVACALGVFPWQIALTLIVSNYVFKVAVEGLMTPATYAAVGYLKRTEGVDHYDTDTDFNPFRVGVDQP